MDEFQIGQRVKITGGTSAKGKISEIAEIIDDLWIGVRVPTRAKATETIYVTKGSVAPLADNSEDAP